MTDLLAIALKHDPELLAKVLAALKEIAGD
jgi:hypothetical protein